MKWVSGDSFSTNVISEIDIYLILESVIVYTLYMQWPKYIYSI
jgi:hypothetical protein